jgi:hypothetical protein
VISWSVGDLVRSGRRLAQTVVVPVIQTRIISRSVQVVTAVLVGGTGRVMQVSAHFDALSGIEHVSVAAEVPPDGSERLALLLFDLGGIRTAPTFQVQMLADRVVEEAHGRKAYSPDTRLTARVLD